MFEGIKLKLAARRERIEKEELERVKKEEADAVLQDRLHKLARLEDLNRQLQEIPARRGLLKDIARDIGERYETLKAELKLLDAMVK